LKVAFVTSQFPCVSETFVLQQITGLLDRGHDVQIFAEKAGLQGHLFAENDQYNLLNRTHYLPPSPLPRWRRWAQTAWLLARLTPTCRSSSLRLAAAYYRNRRCVTPRQFLACIDILAGSFDIVHAHFGPNGLRVLPLMQTDVRSGFVTTFHGYDVTTYVNRYGRAVYEALFTSGDAFTYNSQATAEKLVKLHCPVERMVKVAMGVKLDRQSFRERRLEPGETVNLLSVGRLVEMKGHEYAIRAVSQVKERFSNIRYSIVGSGKEAGNLQALIDELRAGEYIELLGAVSNSQLQDLYRHAHILVHPSVTASNGNMEGQGVVLVEAQAAGLVVLATRHSAFPETVIEGETALLAPERDVNALADNVIRLIEQADRWPAMGRRARRHVEENYDVDKLNDRLVEIYQNVLATKGS